MKYHLEDLTFIPPFFLLYLKILYREIHAIWLTLTSRETNMNKRQKKFQLFIYILHHIHFEFKNSKKNSMNKKNPQKIKN